ncbi:hypothetical protein D3C81_932480 [compost metagenome]
MLVFILKLADVCTVHLLRRVLQLLTQHLKVLPGVVANKPVRSDHISLEQELLKMLFLTRAYGF